MSLFSRGGKANDGQLMCSQELAAMSSTFPIPLLYKVAFACLDLQRYPMQGC